jgi:hypothetical protein
LLVAHMYVPTVILSTAFEPDRLSKPCPPHKFSRENSGSERRRVMVVLIR